MKKIVLLLLSGILILASCNTVPGTGKPELTNELDSVSYALGVVIANNFVKQFDQNQVFDTIDHKKIARAFSKVDVKEEWLKFISDKLDTVNVEVFRKGFLNQVAFGKNGIYNDMMAEITLNTKSRETRERRDEEFKELTQKNLETGIKFLEANKQKEGVVETQSGLQYKIIKEGKGAKPTSTDMVRCIYHGTLLDGTVFDSSKEKGDTATFNVGGVIDGWKEALPMMREGAIWEVYVPSTLAYGERGNRNIEPNSTLIFEIELVSVGK